MTHRTHMTHMTHANSPLRLLPWTTPEGKPCYLSTDDDHSSLSLLADSVEVAQLDSAERALSGARAVLADADAGEHAVRGALARAVDALTDVIRIAVSRGGRSPCDGNA